MKKSLKNSKINAESFSMIDYTCAVWINAQDRLCLFFFTFFNIIKISVKLKIGNKSKYKRNFFFHILTQKFQKKAIFISLSLKIGFIYHSILQSFDLRIRKVRALIFKSTIQTY